MSSSSGSPGDARKAQEYDTTSRQVEVYLFTRPVDPMLDDKIHYHHWALVFVFTGEDVRTAEGFSDSSHKLYPKYTKQLPQEKGNYYTLCTATLSPKDVLQAVVDNPYNGKEYCATWDNCQEGVKALAYRLGGDIAKNIDEYHTLKEADPLIAFAGMKKTMKKRYNSFGSFSSS